MPAFYASGFIPSCSTGRNFPERQYQAETGLHLLASKEPSVIEAIKNRPEGS